MPKSYDPKKHNEEAHRAARDLMGPHFDAAGTLDVGAFMVKLETVVATCLLAVATIQIAAPDTVAAPGDVARTASGFLDALQHGVAERIGMIEGKPYRGT